MRLLNSSVCLLTPGVVVCYNFDLPCSVPRSMLSVDTRIV